MTRLAFVLYPLGTTRPFPDFASFVPTAAQPHRENDEDHRDHEDHAPRAQVPAAASAESVPTSIHVNRADVSLAATEEERKQEFIEGSRRRSRIAEAMTPGRMSGKVIRQKVMKLLMPRSSEASSMLFAETLEPRHHHQRREWHGERRRGQLLWSTATATGQPQAPAPAGRPRG